MRRSGGFFLALPEHALSEEALVSGSGAGPEDVLGPSTLIQVSAALMDESSLLMEPQSAAGQFVSVVLLDVQISAAPLLTATGLEELDGTATFDHAMPSLVPQPGPLISMSWAQNPAAEPERLHLYSATEDVSKTPVEEAAQASPNHLLPKAWSPLYQPCQES